MSAAVKMKVSDRVRADIERMISEEMSVGDRLPTEEKLCEMLNASRTSVREALKALEIAMVVEKRNGGTFVADKPAECFVEPLRIMMRLDEADTKDLLQIRRILESNAAAISAVNASDEDIATLEKLVWLIQKPDIERDEYIAWDIDFHLAIAKASGNVVLEQLIKDVNTVLSKSFPRVCTLEIIREKAIPQQIALMDAIKRHDEEGARSWMLAHLCETEDMM